MFSKLLRGLAAVLRGDSTNVRERIAWPSATAHIVHRRPTRWLVDGSPDPDSYVTVGEGRATNVITTVGRDFLHTQGYATSGIGANGLNYIALSNDTLTETSASTTLSNEITLNGLGRAQGTVAHTTGTAVTTVQKVFTATGTQSAQKAALFNASSSGTMCHALSFTQRNLVNGDTLTITFTITLG